MAECSDGRTNRGTRSQFRIGLPGLGLCKGFYPVNFGKIMDAGQSSQISSSSPSRDLISPCNGTHTLTVREYENSIDQLKKENFNLKLRLYLCDEAHKKFPKHKDEMIEDDEMVQVVVHLSSEVESSRAEIEHKDKLLQDTLERAEKSESDCKELQKINADLQSELASFSEHPSKEEFSLLLEEKENFRNHIVSLENIIKEKEEEIDVLNQKIEKVSDANTSLEEEIKCLEEKMEKKNFAIQSFLYKDMQENKKLPNELKTIVISATQAAKNKNKEDLVVAMKAFTSALNEIMYASELTLNQSEGEYSGSPIIKCLNEENLEISTGPMHSSRTVSQAHITQIQSLEDVLSERNMKTTQHLDSSVYHPYIRGKMVHQNSVNISEKDVMNVSDISPSTEHNLPSFSERHSLETCSVMKHNNVLIENEQLKHVLKEKLVDIEKLSTACEELRGLHLQQHDSDAFKASEQHCASAQTEIAGNSLLNDYDIRKLQKDPKLIDNVEELQEYILLLLIAIAEKNQDLSEVKKSLDDVQTDLRKALNTTNMYEKDFYMRERNELYERLTLSCSVNEELMKQLKDLERFMEDLLLHNFDSSLESIIDNSDVMSTASRCLNQSLKLSRMLSEQLSICEGSKLFEECELSNNYSEERIPPLPSLDEPSYNGSRKFEEYISHAQKNSLGIGKESDSSQLCWRCCQQLNPPLSQSEVSHLMQNNFLTKPIGYQSSDSDIWSEPDRNVSMQRIGISLQNSPVSSKSPRKLRQKDKRISSRISTKEDTSTSEYQQAFKKRQGSASRRLFPKEDSKTQDLILEKFYLLVEEKCSKFKSLLDELDSISNRKLSNYGWNRLNRIVLAIEEAYQKLHFAKENAKLSPICGKCMMLELFLNIKASYIEADFFIEEDSYEHKILEEFSEELYLLEEACKEPFSLLYESVIKKSVSPESGTLIESEQMEKVMQLLSENREALASVKTENSNLLTEIDNLKKDLLSMEYKKKELSLKNKTLENDLISTSKNNSELSCTLKDLKQEKKELSIAVDRLTAELKSNGSDLADMCEKCIEYEKQLNEQIHRRESCEKTLKDLESESVNEKNYYLHKINDLNADKNLYYEELKAIREKRLALEKENAVLNDRLQSKNNEILSLKEKIQKLQGNKETVSEIENEISSEERKISKLLNQVGNLKEELLDMKYENKGLLLENKNLLEKLDHINKNYSDLCDTFKDHKKKMEESCAAVDELKAELKKNRLDLDYMNKKCLTYEKQLNDQIQMKERQESEFKNLECNSSSEKQNYLNQTNALNAEKIHYQQELKDVQENVLVLEKENAIINNSLQLKNDEIESLKKTIEKLEKDKEAVISDHDNAKESSESVMFENLTLSNHVNQLEEELSCMKNKETELNLKNEKLGEQVIQLSKNNSDLISVLNSLEQKIKESSISLNQMTAELKKDRSDHICMTEKCLEYEKQLNEQKHLKESTENKLKHLVSELLSEKNNYLLKTDELNAEKNQYFQELKAAQEKIHALEKENAIINERLQFKSTELKKLQSIKETHNDIENESVSKENLIMESIKTENHKLLNQVSHVKEALLTMKYREKELLLENQKLVEELNQINKNYFELDSALKNLKQEKKESNSTADQLKAELHKNSLDLDHMHKKCLAYEKQVKDQIQLKEKYENELKTLQFDSLSEKQNYLNQLNIINYYQQELKNIQEKMHALEKKNAIVNSSLQSNNAELLSLQKTIENLENDKKALMSEIKEAKQLSESIKNENLKLSKQINQLETQLSHMKNKEKEFWQKNTKLIEELNEINKVNSKLSNTLEVLELRRKDSNIELEQLTADLQKNKSDLSCLSEKCLTHEKELETQELKSLNEKQYYISQINDLNVEKDHYLQELDSVQEKKLVLEKEISAVNDTLQYKSNELFTLQKLVKELQKAKEILSSDYKDLQQKLVNTQECLTDQQEKFKKSDEVIAKFKENEAEYRQQLKQLQVKSDREKDKLLNEISVLTKEKGNILQKLNDEKESCESLKAENIELNENYSKSTQQFSSVKQRNEFFENALLSSNKECDILNKDLKCLRNTLQNLESKCLMYEKQLVAAAGMKDNLIECLLTISSEFSVQRQKLNEMCKIYGNDESVVLDETSFARLIPSIDEDNVSNFCENVVSETKKLSQFVNILFSILKSSHLKFVETESSEEKSQIETQDLKKEMVAHETEAEKLRLQNDEFRHIIEQLQESVLEKEKSIQNNGYEIRKLKEKIQSMQKEIDRENQLNQRKDDEITMLQERIFNLQTYMNTIMANNKYMLEKATSTIENSGSSNNQLSSNTVLTETKMCQTDEPEFIAQGVDENFTSANSFEAVKRHCCEKYLKRCHSLQTKLDSYRTHIEILENDKADLKERLLQKLQNKKDSDKRRDSEVSKIVELETKLEKRKNFIIELKDELLSTCNSLIDKEKEIDCLKQKLAEHNVKSKHEELDVSKKHPSVTLSSVDENVKTLKSQKWTLIQTVFEIMRKFYEKKGIHVNHFDRFKEHINNLYSLQLIPSVSKSESLPLLNSHSLKEQYEQGNEKVKKLADLELDIECFENLKIFLNRFLAPCVFETTEISDKKTEIKQRTVSSNQLPLLLEAETETDFKHEMADILNLSFPDAGIMADNEKSPRISVIASIISQHLECIKKFLDAVVNKNWVKILDLSVEEFGDKSEVKLLLLKIFQEINVLHQATDKLFSFNSHLKSFDSVASAQASLSTIKLDASDRESVMSEETIAVSRTESPMSFEDICPITLPHPETLHLEESTLKLGSKVTVIEPYNTKTTVVDGSCDSVCHRSHYSSPDLGIESDPNHDSSAPEHKEEEASKYQRFIREGQIFPLKPQPKTAFTSAESAGRWPGPNFEETFYAVGSLPHFELLKQEIKESLVAIKSVLSRTGDGLHHIVKYTSPRKTLEYNTLKSIKDTCVHMDRCLKEANNLIGKFWTAPCSTEKECKLLKEENQKLKEKLLCLQGMIDEQEKQFKTATEKLQHAKDNFDKKLSKKLVKTKKMIRQAELKLLETRCQNFSPVPEYPNEQIEQAGTRNHAH